MAGDRVLAVDGATTTEMSIDKALYLIRGEVGTSVQLTIFRDAEKETEPRDVVIVREEITVPTIDTKMEDGVFVISLYGFPATGGELFRGALREFAQSGTDKLVLDLRGNPGGYLEIAVDMASWFLPEGKVIVREEERGGGGRVYRSRGYNAFGDDFHMVILVDEGSASASEILAGALAQHGVATLVGQTTFGKGSVQELVNVGKDAALKLTVARWITPDGTNLSAKGLVPDVVVENTREDVEAGRDPQLARAIEVAKERRGQ
jgi:carboxyl-terminal processing protease